MASLMSEKKQIIKIQQRLPLAGWETVEVSEMTFDEACQKANEYLSPEIAAGATGNAFSVRISRLWKNDWIYIPQWLENNKVFWNDDIDSLTEAFLSGN